MDVDGSNVVAGRSFRSVTDHLEVPAGEREVTAGIAILVYVT